MLALRPRLKPSSERSV